MSSSATANYRVFVRYDRERSVFVARAPELEHCAAEDPNRIEALQKLEREIEAQVANIREHGGQLPPPIDDDLDAYTGELVAKVSRGLHRELVLAARVEGISLDQLLVEMLGRGLEARQRRVARQGQPQPADGDRALEDRRWGPGSPSPRGPREGRGYGNQGGRYHQILEDRATFVEYVRQLEQGGPPRGRGDRGPRRGGRDRQAPQGRSGGSSGDGSGEPDGT